MVQIYQFQKAKIILLGGPRLIEAGTPMECGAFEEVLPVKERQLVRKVSMDKIQKFVYIMFQQLCFKIVCCVFQYFNSLKSTSYRRVLWTIS